MYIQVQYTSYADVYMYIYIYIYIYIPGIYSACAGDGSCHSGF